MGTCEYLCRLCLTSLTGDEIDSKDIFMFPTKKASYAKDILELLGLQLHEKLLWPSKACADCLQGIDQLKSLKNTITSSQDALSKLMNDAEVMVPVDMVETELLVAKEEFYSDGDLHLDDYMHDYDDSQSVDYPVRTTRNGAALEPTRRTRSGRSYEPPPPPKPKKVKAQPKPPRERDDDWRPASEKKVKEKCQATVAVNEEKKAKIEQEKIAKYIEKYNATPEAENTLKSLNLLICKTCNAPLDTFYQLYQHLHREHGADKQKIYVECCNKQFNLYNVHDHALYHMDNDAFKCPGCDKQMMSRYHRKKHMKVRHLPESERKFECDQCSRLFFGWELKDHMKRHAANPFFCTQCKKMFLTNDMLEDHIRFTHENIPRHICEVCGKGYKNSVALGSHRKLHLGPKVRNVQQCDVCQLFFCDLATHKKRAHTDGGRQSAPCEHCGKKFSRMYLKQHLKRAHPTGNDAMYPCTICDKQFRMKQNLQKHMNIHMGVRFPCFFCDETYGDTRNRLKHLQCKHKEDYEEYKRKRYMEKIEKYRARGPETDHSTAMNDPGLTATVSAAEVFT